MRMKQPFSLILIAVGAVLLLSGVGYTLLDQAVRDPAPAPLPDQLAGLPVVRKTTGWQAVDEIARLHRKEFPLSSAAVGVYGLDQGITLWVSGAPLELMAGAMLSAMRESIAKGNSPFTPTRERRDGGRTIYELDGMEQKHFYFLSGNLLIWLAADPALAESAISQILEFYP